MGGHHLQSQAQVSALLSRLSLVALPSCFVLAPWLHWTISPSQIPCAHSCLGCFFCLLLPASLCCLCRMQSLTFRAWHLLKTPFLGLCEKSQRPPLHFHSILFIFGTVWQADVSHLRDCGSLEANGGLIISFSVTAWSLVDVVELNWVT